MPVGNPESEVEIWKRRSELVKTARENGYELLSPVEAQLAIEFVTSGCTLRALAKKTGQPFELVKRTFADPLVRAFISDMQKEVAQHQIINRAWVEQQILGLWPKFIGEEEVSIVLAKTGQEVSAKKFHAGEVAAMLKHFGGNEDQKKAGGVQVQINFGAMGVSPTVVPTIDVTGAEDV